jgi:hypothetical protein
MVFARREFPAHLVYPRAGGGRCRRLHVDFHELADAQVPELAEAEAHERALHRCALDVEDAGLQPDEDPGLHALTSLRYTS